MRNRIRFSDFSEKWRASNLTLTAKFRASVAQLCKMSSRDSNPLVGEERARPFQRSGVLKLQKPVEEM